MKCEKCGKIYFEKECPHCKLVNQITGKKDKATKGQLLLLAALTITTVIFAIFVFKPFQSPLVGKWESEKAIPFLGKMKIEFESDAAIMMGIYSKVKYKEHGNKIIVTDQTGVGTVYEMIDNDTMYTEALNMKTIYKRIK